MALTLLFFLNTPVFSQESEWQYRLFKFEDTSVPGPVTSVAEDVHGVIWFGTEDDGLALYDGYNWNSINHIPGSIAGLASNRVNTILPDTAGDRMLIGTSNGLSVYHDGLLVVNHLPENNVLSLALESSEICWLGTANGLVRLNFNTRDTQLYFCPASTSVPFTRNENAFVSLLFHNKHRDTLWVGSQNGLKSFDLVSKKFAHHYNPRKWHDIRPEYQQFHIKDLVYLDGQLHLGAAGSGGVLSYHYGQWGQYLYNGGDQSAPYFNNSVNAIVPVGEYLVTGTNTSFGYVDPTLGVLVALDLPELHSMGRIRDMCIAKNGFLWLAMQQGIARMQTPVGLSDQLYPPRLTEILVDGESVSWRDSLRLLNADVNLRLTFSSPNYSAPETLSYRWQLRGVDDSWSAPANEGIATYSGLNGGVYKFQFQCRDKGEWTGGKSLVVDIHTPWHDRPFIIALFLLLVLILAYTVARIISAVSERRTSRRSELERRTINAELVALRSQTNPHFIFNSLGSIYKFIQDNDTTQAAEYLSKFATLMRMVLAHSQARAISLESELSALGIYLELEKIRFGQRFNFTVSADTATSVHEIFIPPLLIQPYTETAIWHGFSQEGMHGSLSVQIEQQPADRMRITIEVRSLISGFYQHSTQPYKSFISEDRLESLSVLYKAPFVATVSDILDQRGLPNGIRVILDIQTIESPGHYNLPAS